MLAQLHKQQRMPYNLHDYVVIIKDFLDLKTCKTIIKKTKNLDWHIHSYSSGYGDTHSYDNDLSILNTDIPEVQELNSKLWNVLKTYYEIYKFDWHASWDGYSYVRLNKYDVNTEMRLHCDHIKTLFDGTIKGNPTLTMLGALNDNYSGGELVMFDSEIIELKAGNIMIFPSTFLYPHQVLPVTKGVRYSYVSWSY